jgi:hypothetical protein
MASSPQRRDKWWRWLLEAIMAVGLLVGGLLVFGRAAEWSAYHGDEGHYLWSARYFDWLFVEHDLARSDWGDNYYTHTQPMFTRYLLGAWLWSRRQHPDSIPQLYDRYDHGSSLEENRRAGRVPDDALLAEARAPMVVGAAVAVVLLYLLGRALAGPVAGLAAAGFALGSPFTQELMVRATPEALLACCLLFGLWLGLQGARRSRAGGLPLGWAVPLGFVLGLAAGTKLTGFLSVASTLAWGLLMAGLAAFRPAGQSSLSARLARAASAGRGWGLAVAIALGVYTISNPHLYPNPLLHTLHLFEQGGQELAEAQRNVPGDALLNPLDRPGRLLEGSLVSGTLTGSRGYPIEAILTTIGVGTLLVATRRGWQRRGRVPAEALLLLTGLTYTVGVSATLFLAWPRYYIPTLLLGCLCSGVGLASLFHRLRASVPRSALPSRSPVDHSQGGSVNLRLDDGRL